MKGKEERSPCLAPSLKGMILPHGHPLMINGVVGTREAIQYPFSLWSVKPFMLEE